MSLLSTPRASAAKLAEPLPVTNSHLNKYGIKLRKGQSSIWAAAPGVGKSLVANNLAVRTKVPTVFFSADSDEYTVRTRTLAILTGHQLTEIEQRLEEPAWAAEYSKTLARADHIDWCFRTDIDVEFIANRLLAHAEVRGEYPQLVVIDNLGNTVVEDSNAWDELRATAREVQSIARKADAHVMTLHHVKGAKEDGFKVITQGDLLANVAKIPEQVFGLNRITGNPTHLHLQVGKNRGGKSNFGIELPVSYETATIGGFQ